MVFECFCFLYLYIHIYIYISYHDYYLSISDLTNPGGLAAAQVLAKATAEGNGFGLGQAGREWVILRRKMVVFHGI